MSRGLSKGGHRAGEGDEEGAEHHEDEVGVD